MRLGIIGLPASGKTTIFNTLTGSERPTTASIPGRLELVQGIVDLPDERVDRLSAIFKPRRTVYARVTYVDIAGLDQEMGKKGLSGQLRNQIATMDALLHVVRAFENAKVPHPLGRVDPQRDLEVMEGEMILADLMTVENRLARIEEGLKKGARGEERQRLFAEHALFERLRSALEAERPLRDLDLEPDAKALLRGFGLLTLKPQLILLNTDEPVEEVASLLHYDHRQTEMVAMQGQLEMEIAQLDAEEAELFMEEFGLQEPGRARVIRASYALLGMQSFFTVGEDEVRAWTVRRGATALDAAAVIHTDLARGFIRAEVVHYDDLIAAGGMTAARKAGKVRLEGKDYLVRDGDILHIRFSI